MEGTAHPPKGMDQVWKMMQQPHIASDAFAGQPGRDGKELLAQHLYICRSLQVKLQTVPYLINMLSGECTVTCTQSTLENKMQAGGGFQSAPTLHRNVPQVMCWVRAPATLLRQVQEQSCLQTAESATDWQDVANKMALPSERVATLAKYPTSD